MRSPIRRRHVALVALSAGVLVTAGCGGDAGGDGSPEAKELFLQSASSRTPDPFTESTASASSERRPGAVAGSGRGTSGQAAPAPSGGATPMARSLPGSTPGLYTGTRSRSSCDVERQVRMLTEETSTAEAFAKGAGVGAASVPSFVRGLTPVVLRTDVRVTNHGFRGGSVRSYQSVLQAGTAVMVDDRGMPRVRCAGGSPLGPAVAMRGSVVHRGAKWAAYRPERVVVITRAPEVVGGLVIVNVIDTSWIERRTGTDGDEDVVPAIMPPYAADADITDPGAVAPPGRPDPGRSSVGPDAPSAEPSGSDPVGPGPSDPGPGLEATPPTPEPTEQLPEPPAEEPPGDIPPLPAENVPTSPDDPGTAPDEELYPTTPDQQEAGTELVGPDTFQG